MDEYWKDDWEEIEGGNNFDSVQDIVPVNHSGEPLPAEATYVDGRLILSIRDPNGPTLVLEP